MSWLLVALGGAAGAGARFGVAQAFAGRGFPWATFGINAAGSLLLGLVMGAYAAEEAWRVRALLGVGFCGGFTTFSTFSFEALLLLQRGSPGAALAYAGGSVLAGVLFAWAGLALAS